MDGCSSTSTSYSTVPVLGTSIAAVQVEYYSSSTLEYYYSSTSTVSKHIGKVGVQQNFATTADCGAHFQRRRLHEIGVVGPWLPRARG